MTGKVAAKETKAKVPKQASSEKKTSSNPSYVQMVVKAIVSLTEATSYETTSLRKILEFIHSSFQCNGTEKSVNNRVKIALKKCVDENFVTQKTGLGLNGSFRLNAEQKKKYLKGKLYEKKNAPTNKETEEKSKTVVKKTSAKPATPKVKKMSVKKPAVSSAKKSPAAKKAPAKKTAAKK